MASLITLSSKHVQNNGYNNTFRFDIPTGAANFQNREVALASVKMFNSQFNINDVEYGNNTFSIIVPTGSTTSTINITLPNGYYSYLDLNNYIQSKLIAAGAYLIDGSGNNVFYIKMQANSTYYSCQVDLLSTPTSLPASYTRPSSGLYSLSGTGLPSTAYAPQIVFPANFNSIVGFSVGTYPSAQTTTSQSILSNITPQINPVSCYLIRCNLVNNIYSQPPDILFSFSSGGTTIGQSIDVKVNQFAWIDIPDQTKSYIEIIITDQFGRFVKFQDNQIVIQLLIRKKN